MLAICGWCGKHISRSPRRVNKFKKLFCNMEHYMLYRRQNPDEFSTKKKEVVI